jgi:hypothetical protein
VGEKRGQKVGSVREEEGVMGGSLGSGGSGGEETWARDHARGNRQGG